MNVDIYENGVPYWVALSTEDPKSASKFYGALFGWRAPDSSAKGDTHDVFLLRGLPVAGIAPKRSGTGRPASCPRLSSLSPVMVKYTLVAETFTWPRYVDKSGRRAWTSAPSRYHAMRRCTAKVARRSCGRGRCPG